jgi:hypothetical protein
LLKTLGQRHQVRATLAGGDDAGDGCIAVGLPIGLLLGTLVWRRVAEASEYRRRL